MRWLFDNFDLMEEAPSHEGQFAGSRNNQTQIINGATTGASIALALNGRDNYIFWPGAKFKPAFSDITQARLGISVAFFIRIINRLGRITISGNTQLFFNIVLIHS